MVWGAVARGKQSPLLPLPLAPSSISGRVRKKAEELNGQKYSEWTRVMTSDAKCEMRV